MPTAAPCCSSAGAIKAAIRGHFQAQGFTEVECGALVVSPGNETHLHAFETGLTGPDGSSSPLYLHTSPEFAAKKLLAAGETQDLRFRPGLPQPRTRPAACAGIHHAGMVPGAGRLSRR